MVGGLVDACSRLPHDVVLWNGECCFIRDVQLCSLYFVMAVYEITRHVPIVFTVFFFENCVFFFFFILHKASPRGHCAAWGLRKISELKRSICTSKQQASFLCDFQVFQPFDVNIGGSQVLEVFAARAWQIA